MGNRRNGPMVIAGTCVLAAFSSIVTAAERSLGDLSGPWQLFVDDYAVASKDHVTRVYHPFEKHAGNPVMVGDKPWEGNDIYLFGTVLPGEDGTGYRMWYQTIPREGEINSVLYATSKDGIHWDKPNLGIRSRHGSTDNNMLFPGDKSSFMASVMYTPWDADPQRRYHSIRLVEGGYAGAFSPDGLHFTDVPGNPVVKGCGDSAQFLWAPHARQYVSYGKVVFPVDGSRRRCVGRSATKDFGTWPKFDLILAPDTIDDRWVKDSPAHRTHLYGMSAFAYESMYIGLLWIFRATDDEGYLVGPVFVELVTSRDGIHWLREEGVRPPILPLGKPGTWDDSQLYTPNQPLVEGHRIRLYYAGFDEDHGRPMHGKIGLAFLRKDGFASLDATDAEGTVLTRRFEHAGGDLHVNYAAANGWVKVEVLDAAGKVLPGYGRDECDALSGDAVDKVVTWKGKRGLPTGQDTLRLRFILHNASLYSFMAGTRVEGVDEPAPPPLAVLYTFEGGSKRRVEDQLKQDGKQEAQFIGGLAVKTDRAHAAFGDGALEVGSEFCPYNVLEITGTAHLATRFTLACAVRSKDNRHARLFSSYGNCGPVKGADLVFDCDPAGNGVYGSPRRVNAGGLRLICKGISVESKPLKFDDGKYHHAAATYNDGEVRFYLDGRDAGTAFVPGGAPVTMARNLFVGDDAALGGDAHFVGHMDDVLVLGQVLDADQIKTLATKGARFLSLPAAAANR